MKYSIERRLVEIGIGTIQIDFLCGQRVRLRLLFAFDDEDGQDLHHVGGSGRGGRLLLFVGLNRRGVLALRLFSIVFGRRSIFYHDGIWQVDGPVVDIVLRPLSVGHVRDCDIGLVLPVLLLAVDRLKVQRVKVEIITVRRRSLFLFLSFFLLLFVTFLFLFFFAVLCGRWLFGFRLLLGVGDKVRVLGTRRFLRSKVAEKFALILCI